MAAAPFEKQVPDVVKKAPERVRKLTFSQKAVLAAGIIVLGGAPAALLTIGSVRVQPPQTYYSSQPAVMSNTSPFQLEACTAPSSREELKPTMSIQHREK